ncbi:MAG TPA: LolA-related protein [Steroidobacteraceae bacterium]|nr:LolA-related protein [Steroidobacteraceae bacterium]
MRARALAAIVALLTAQVATAAAPAAAAQTGQASSESASAQGTTATADLDRLMSALAQRKHGHVTFVEEKYLSMLDKPVKSSGELLYDAPDRLEQRTLSPKRETLVLQNGVVTADRGRRHYVLDLRQYPQIVPFIESIRATLAGDRAALERVFRLSFSGTFDSWTLILRPLDEKLAHTLRQIDIDGTQAAIHKVQIQEADGDRSVLSIGAEVTE